MKYKKGETVYVISQCKVKKEVLEYDITYEDSSPHIPFIFRDKDAAEKMSKLINDATDKILRGNAFVLDAKVEKVNDKDTPPTKETWNIYTHVCVDETKKCNKD